MKRYAIISGFIMALIRFLYKEDKEIHITERTVESSRLPEAFDGYRIVHVSDYHNAWFGRKAGRLLHEIREADGDVIFITGDIIDRRTPNLRRSRKFIKYVTEILPTYYVTGNHEAHYKKWWKLRKYIEKSDMKNISHDTVQVTLDGQSINVAGMPDVWFLGFEDNPETLEYFKAELDRRMSGLSDDFTILMSHRPELLHIYSRHDIDLVLSGHAHGGQIRLPAVKGLYAPHQGLLPKYSEGMHEQNGTILAISRGLGNSRFPFRVFNHPEIVVVTLKRI